MDGAVSQLRVFLIAWALPSTTYYLTWVVSCISMFHLCSSTFCGFDLPAIVSIYTSRDEKVTKLISGKWTGKYFDNQFMIFFFLTNIPLIPVNHFWEYAAFVCLWFVWVFGHFLIFYTAKQLIGYLFNKKTGQLINMKIINKEKQSSVSASYFTDKDITYHTTEKKTIHTIQVKVQHLNCYLSKSTWSMMR